MRLLAQPPRHAWTSQPLNARCTCALRFAESCGDRQELAVVPRHGFHCSCGASEAAPRPAACRAGCSKAADRWHGRVAGLPGQRLSGRGGASSSRPCRQQLSRAAGCWVNLDTALFAAPLFHRFSCTNNCAAKFSQGARLNPTSLLFCHACRSAFAHMPPSFHRQGLGSCPLPFWHTEVSVMSLLLSFASAIRVSMKQDSGARMKHPHTIAGAERGSHSQGRRSPPPRQKHTGQPQPARASLATGTVQAPGAAAATAAAAPHADAPCRRRCCRRGLRPWLLLPGCCWLLRPVPPRRSSHPQSRRRPPAARSSAWQAREPGGVVLSKCRVPARLHSATRATPPAQHHVWQRAV